MGKTAIDWTDISLNPGIYGCTEVSPACANCYAAGMAHRLVAMGVYPDGITEKRSSGVHWSGKVIVDYDRIKPAFAKLPKKKSARVFVTSMSDLFHEDVPFDFVHEVLKAMEARPHLTFQVLTKRPHMMAAYAALRGGLEWPANVWAGCTVEDQKRADERIPHLLQVPAEVRFLSCEPLVGPVDLEHVPTEKCDDCGEHVLLNAFDASVACRCCVEGPEHVDLGTINWLICGGESGSRARPSNPQWFRSLRDQCEDAGVPFFMKQVTEHGRRVGIPTDLFIREFP